MNKLEYINFQELEKEWRQSLTRFSEKELLEIFPEVKKIIPQKIRELQEKREKITNTAKGKLALIKYKVRDEFSKWFWREWIKVNEGEELLNIDWQLSRFRRLLSISRGKISKSTITEETIQQALSTPIESLINQPLRKTGKALVGLCPFHKEKTPSFFIYPENNSFYCYGCGTGGNAINLARLLYGHSFKEAVKYLIGEK